MKTLKTLVVALALTSTAAIAAETTATAPITNNPAQLKQIIAQQQKEINSLKQQLNAVEPASGQSPVATTAGSENPLLKNKIQYMKK